MHWRSHQAWVAEARDTSRRTQDRKRQVGARAQASVKFETQLSASRARGRMQGCGMHMASRLLGTTHDAGSFHSGGVVLCQPRTAAFRAAPVLAPRLSDFARTVQDAEAALRSRAPPEEEQEEESEEEDGDSEEEEDSEEEDSEEEDGQEDETEEENGWVEERRGGEHDGFRPLPSSDKARPLPFVMRQPIGSAHDWGRPKKDGTAAAISRLCSPGGRSWGPPAAWGADAGWLGGHSRWHGRQNTTRNPPQRMATNPVPRVRGSVASRFYGLATLPRPAPALSAKELTHVASLCVQSAYMHADRCGPLT